MNSKPPDEAPPPGLKWWCRPNYYFERSDPGGSSGSWRCSFCAIESQNLDARAPGHVCACGAIMDGNYDQWGLVPEDFDREEIWA
jgi:hypothetical protein